MGGRFAGQALSGMMLPAGLLLMKPELFGVNPNLLGRKPKNQGIVGSPSPNILERIGLPTGTKDRQPQNVLERMGLPTTTKTTVDPRVLGIANSIYGGVI